MSKQIDMIQYRTVDPLYGFAALTTLLHKVCDNDEKKFEEACRLLELFMKQTIKEMGAKHEYRH